MSKKVDFINYVKDLMDIVDNCQDCVKIPMPENVKSYWEAFCDENKNEKKSMFTDTGKMVFKFLLEHQEQEMWKSKDIANEILFSSRTVSGSMRKLVADGYVEKNGQDPVMYSLTEKGKNTIIND